ncbi:hypothetical protein A3718_05480 [Erythrobacter sp. HI0019]|nr:hypothetical protein A3718_05480 [Erythrobacter sp. HI0019]KZY10026.1 hypothetical protein A3723_08240 [Erythrobacter sp. HI0028]
MMHSNQCVVVDIETRPDRFARMIASEKRVSRSPLLIEVVNASTLVFTMSPSGLIDDLALSSYHADDYPETDIVANVALKLRSSIASGGDIVTYNGTRYDLPLLRLRMLRWWTQSSDDLVSLQDARSHHRDMMVAFPGPLGKAPSLQDCCAMLGYAIHGPIEVAGTNPVPPQRRKCECDVMGTAILYLYTRAESDGGEALEANLRTLGDFLRKNCAGLPHLARLGSDSLLGQEPGPWRGAADDAYGTGRPTRRGRPPKLFG